MLLFIGLRYIRQPAALEPCQIKTDEFVILVHEKRSIFLHGKIVRQRIH